MWGKNNPDNSGHLVRTLSRISGNTKKKEIVIPAHTQVSMCPSVPSEDILSEYDISGTGNVMNQVQQLSRPPAV